MWSSSGQKDYTALSIGSAYGDYDNSKSRRRQSCWRVWTFLFLVMFSIACWV